MLVCGHYVPILTGKQGEFNALRALEPDVLRDLSPFIDMPPIPLGVARAGKLPKRDTPEEALGKLLTAIGTKWGTDRRVMVDLAAYDRYQIAGEHPARWLFREAANRGIWLMAAASTDSSRVYRASLVAEADVLKGLCLRARAFPGFAPEDLAAEVDELAATLPLSDPAHTELMLDLGRIADHRLTDAELVGLVREYLCVLSARNRPVSAIAATAVPKHGVPRGRVHREPRCEWGLWKQLATEPLAQRAAFADYGITGPRPDDETTGVPDPHLRYTTDAALLMWRGRDNSRADLEDPDKRAVLFPELCVDLLRHKSDFAGPRFSTGDRAIWLTGTTGHPPGTPTKWIQHATSHHLTHVVRKLQSG
jgi:Beta protein